MDCGRKAKCGCNKVWLSCYDIYKRSLLLNYTGIKCLPVGQSCQEHSNMIQKIFSTRNLITHLPENLHSCYQNLTELYLPSNRLTSLPDGIGRLNCLEDINFSCNNLTELPSSIKSLKKLRCMVLRENQLQNLPQEIGELENLEKLDVSLNRIRHLTQAIGHCRSLIKLWISHNRLTSLPRHLCHLPRLKEIDASSNNLTYLPVELGHSTSFSSISVNENRMLRAIPLHLRVKVVRFRCTSPSTLNEAIASHFGLQIIRILTSSYENVVFLQPANYRHCISEDPPTLKSMSLKILYGSIKNGDFNASYAADLPEAVYNLLLVPEGFCFSCNKPLFDVVYVKYLRAISFVAPSIVSTSSELFVLAYFCSLRCSQNLHVTFD